MEEHLTADREPDVRLRNSAFRVPEIVQEAYRLFFRNFWPILVIVMLVALPVEFVKNHYFVSPDESLYTVYRRDSLTALFFLSLITPTLISYMLGKLQSGADMSIGRSFLHGFRKWHLIIGYGMLSSLIVFAGLILLVVPGIVFYFRLAFVPAVITVEGTRGKDPIGISNRLAKGRTFRMFLCFLLAGLGLVPIWLIGFALNYFLTPWLSTALLDLLLDVFLDLFVQVFTILALLIYLRIRSE